MIMNRTETLLTTGNQKVICAANYEKEVTLKFTREINYISKPYGVLIKHGVTMRFVIILLILCTCCITNVSSQTKQISDIIAIEDRILLEKKIMKQFKKKKCYDKDKKYIIPSCIYALYSTEPRYKEDFLDGSFVDNLEVCYTKKKVFFKWKKDHLWLIFPSYIYCDNGKLVGMSDGRITSCDSNPTYTVSHQKAIEYFNNPDLIYFVLQNASISLLFAVDNENNIYITNTNRKPFELCPLHIYIEKYWDEGLLSNIPSAASVVPQSTLF
jgi:hypothetical protein